MERAPDLIAELWRQHRGKIVGAACGLILAVVVMTAGFWWTLFIAICVAAGFVLGKRIDEGHDAGGFLDRFVPRKDRDR